MKQLLLNKNSDELLIFFCGWGMDERPFREFEFGCDVLFLYSYSSLKLNFDFSRYSKIRLVAYSYGVFMSSLFKLPKIDYAVAINGTLKPVDNEFGIAEKIFKLTLENMTLETALKFRRKLFNDEADFQRFNRNLPNRLIDDIQAELNFISKCAHDFNNGSIDFDKIIISTEDKIYPTKSQRAFWANHENIKEISSGHFPFYQFENFQDITELR